MTDLIANRAEPVDLAAVKARIERHRCNAPRSGDAGFLEVSQILDHDAPALLELVEQSSRLLETALVLLTRGEDPRANRTVRRFEHEASTFLAALNKPGEETP